MRGIERLAKSVSEGQIEKISFVPGCPQGDVAMLAPSGPARRLHHSRQENRM